MATLMCLLGLAAAAPAQAAWPGGNGAIAFSRNGSAGRSGGDIWVQLPSGGQRQLTSARSGNDGEPAYSRDGRKIAFSRYSGGDFDIWVMNSDGSDKHPVTETDGHAFETEPAFLPSGRSLVFAQTGVTGGPKVFSVRIDGTGLRLQANRAKAPTVSPDGRWLAYRRHPGGDRIRLKDLRTGEERQLPTGLADQPDFSPDGRRLVFVGKRPCGKEGNLRQSLLTIGLEDRHPRMLLDTCGRKFIPFTPVWSPRGNRIAFTRAEDLGSRPKNVRLAMATAGGALVPSAPRHRPGTFEGSPSWQPLP